MRWKDAEYTGWGRVLKAEGQLARPEKRAGLTALLAEKQVPAIGNCRSYGDACLNSGGKAVDMTRLDRFLGFDETTGVLSVEAGITIGEVARVMAPKGWLPAVMPGTGFATVGGAIANDVHGKNHHGAGTFGQHVAGFTLVNHQGTAYVTPDSDPDLFRATMGGLGQTGVIISADLQLARAKGDIVTVTERRAEDLDAFLALFEASDATYSVGWIDAKAQGDDLGRGILEEAETGAGLIPAPKPSKSVPMDAPSFALSSPVVKLFNAAYYRRVPARGRSVVKPIEEFFFPLDRIHDWNRLYGKRGFHQFQCVVPTGETEALREMLGRISDMGIASPLAVLKRLGAGRAGHMSFPMEGYTLAVDFPNKEGAARLIKQLEDITAEAGGRIYLAKDSLSSRQRVRAMYPEFQAWAAQIAKADPEGDFATDLVRRLGLREAS
ncbi:L-fuco-beta-pyranose dehydrogenase [Candidatus Rhodobacter oscarellae]|uniref:L-fuco-beta-pyranose dehydrogenase n=1 Tax=Candidatus Rhodobacter oscarellae TaxID=1675527 RepID=A0A0J9EA68_9RHOB|nr:FAD-binding oxidoreductase [Candidatus Rhodobacter lobularis]KMW59531.1 L-fuco-beta-pyranose dehydrogenase [Candidatus Rhodobacter lobularis]